MATTTYQEYVITFAPANLLKTWGRAFLQGIAKVIDTELLDRAKESVKAHILEEAPVSALAALGRERLLERYPPMSDATYREYLKAAWDTWPGGGTEAGILAALSVALPGPGYALLDRAGIGGYPYPSWVSFYIYIGAPLPWDYWQYGNSHTWGESGLTWGSTMTSAELKFLRALIRKWKAGHSHLQGIILALSPELIIPGTPSL